MSDDSELSLDNLILRAFKNAESDRSKTMKKLNDMTLEVNNSSDASKEQISALLFSKYIETLQRSNEQLIKLVGVIQKREKDISDPEEVDNNVIFNFLQEEENREGK